MALKNFPSSFVASLILEPKFKLMKAQTLLQNDV